MRLVTTGPAVSGSRGHACIGAVDACDANLPKRSISKEDMDVDAAIVGVDQPGFSLAPWNWSPRV